MHKNSRLFMAGAALVAFVFLFFSILVVLQLEPFYSWVRNGIDNPSSGFVKVLKLTALLISAFAMVFVFLFALFGGRFNKSRAKSNDIGVIDIGVGAIENIALNAAKAAQAGIKTAKARVYAAENDEVLVELSAVLYSDVEIPLQMARIQERVKKDVEKYTGIGVANVRVKVNRVESIGTRVER